MVVGFISQIFFAICLLPQVIKLFTAKTTKGVSWLMWLLQAGGYSFGLKYGLNLKEFPLIIGNLWGIVCSIAFAVGFLKYRDN